MKVVISDTSPINYLVLIGKQDILPSLFERIIIPHAVYRELNAEASPPEIREWIAVAPDWLEIRPPTLAEVRSQKSEVGGQKSDQRSSTSDN